MKTPLIALNSLVGAALLTLVTAAGALLYLMFSTDDAGVRREAFFGALMFEAVDRPDGTTSITTGVEQPLPLLVLFVVLAAMLTVMQLTYRALKAYRAELLAE